MLGTLFAECGQKRFLQVGFDDKTRKGNTPAILLSQLDFDAYEIKSAELQSAK